MSDKISSPPAQPQLPPSQQEVTARPQGRQSGGRNAATAAENTQPPQRRAANQVTAKQVFAAASRTGSGSAAGPQEEHFTRGGPGRVPVKRGHAVESKPGLSENSVYKSLADKSKITRTLTALKPTPFAGKVRAATKVEHKGGEAQTKAQKAKALAKKEGQQWKQLGKTAGGLAALAGRNVKNKVTGKATDDPALQLNKASPGRKLLKTGMNKIFQTDSKEDLKKSFSEYLESTRPGSSINVSMSTQAKWGPRVPIGAIISLPVGPSVGVDVNHNRATGFKIEKQSDENFSITLKYDKTDGAGGRLSVAPGVGEIDNSFAFGGVFLGGDHKESRDIVIKDQPLAKVAEFFEQYSDHDLSKDQSDDAVYGKKKTNKLSAWAAAGPGVYADSVGEANAGAYLCPSVSKDLGGTEKHYKMQASPADGGVKVKTDVTTQKVEAKPVFWNVEASTDAGFGYALTALTRIPDLDPTVAAADPNAPVRETGEATGNWNVTGRHQQFGGSGAELTRSKAGSDPAEKRASVKNPGSRPPKSSDLSTRGVDTKSKEAGGAQAAPSLFDLSASRSAIPTRKERWAAEGGSGLRPAQLFGKARAAKIMEKAISTIKKATGSDYDVRKRNLKFDVSMTVKPEAFDTLKQETIKDAGVDYEAALEKKLKTVLENPKKFHDLLNFNVSVTESKTYGQGASYSVPFVASVVEKADITFERSFELGNIDNENALVYDRRDFEETYGKAGGATAAAPSAGRSAAADAPASSATEGSRRTVSAAPQLATIPEEDEGTADEAGHRSGARASASGIIWTDMGEV